MKFIVAEDSYLFGQLAYCIVKGSRDRKTFINRTRARYSPIFASLELTAAITKFTAILPRVVKMHPNHSYWNEIIVSSVGKDDNLKLNHAWIRRVPASNINPLY